MMDTIIHNHPPPGRDPELVELLGRLVHGQDVIRRAQTQTTQLIQQLINQGVTMNQKADAIAAALEAANVMTNNISTTLGSVVSVTASVLAAEAKQLALIQVLTDKVAAGQNVEAELEVLRARAQANADALAPINTVLTATAAQLAQATTDVANPFPEVPPVVVEPPPVVEDPGPVVDPGGDPGPVVDPGGDPAPVDGE